jgi:hypothetical protein
MVGGARDGRLQTSTELHRVDVGGSGIPLLYGETPSIEFSYLPLFLLLLKTLVPFRRILHVNCILPIATLLSLVRKHNGEVILRRREGLEGG